MTEAEIGKLRWRCRRGMRELDVLLTRYVEEQYREATPVYQEAFRQLLDSQDPQIYAYFLGRVTPPTALMGALIERITSGRPAGNVRTTDIEEPRGC